MSSEKFFYIGGNDDYLCALSPDALRDRYEIPYNWNLFAKTTWRTAMHGLIAHYEPQPRINLAPVMELLEYLFAIDDRCEHDRQLTWAEDVQACFILERLVPKDNEAVNDYLKRVISSQDSKYRTLCVWYMIAKYVAQLIADEE